MRSEMCNGLLSLFVLSGILFSCTPVKQTADPLVSPTLEIEAVAPAPFSTVEASVAAPASEPSILRGIAVLGDSFYDEYRGSDLRGGDYADVTFNLVELLVNLRDFNFGPFDDWGYPRRVGYEYNWAHSGDTSADLIRNGQHLGAARQVREGKVTFVFIGIGANDFNPHYGEDYARIYSGAMTDAELQRKIDRAVADVTLAVDTVLEAKPQGLAITLFTQMYMDPILYQTYPNAGGRQRVAQAVDAVNAGLRKMAEQRKVIIVDQNRIGQEMVLSRMKNGTFDIGGLKIDFLQNGDNPIHARLLDGQHLGTVMSGFVANYYFIDTLNTYFHTNIPFLSDDEIRASAGL